MLTYEWKSGLTGQRVLLYANLTSKKQSVAYMLDGVQKRLVLAPRTFRRVKKGLFEEYGWDWTYHSSCEAFRWNVETVIDKVTGKPVSNKDNDRFHAVQGKMNGQFLHQLVEYVQFSAGWFVISC